MNRLHALAAIVPFALCGGLTLWVGCSSSTSGDGAPDGGAGAVHNACASERAAVFRAYCPGHKSFAALNGECAIKCVLERDAEAPTCVDDCLRTVSSGAITDPCIHCHAELVACARKNCLAKCVGGPLDLQCLDCMCGNNYPNAVNCYAPFNDCTGLGVTYCQAYEAGTFDGFPPPDDAGPCSDDDAADAGAAGDARDGG